LHGDAEPAGDAGKPPGCGFILMGHEHPAVRLGDGVASSTRCPCFLVGSRLLILPAFSNWAQGTVTSHYGLMSPLARNERFTRAVAILDDRLLSVPLSSGPAAPLENGRGRTRRDRPPV
jgi:metallophosphoesterase superfamily enzyme